MQGSHFNIEEIAIKPLGVFMYVPPIIWKGDSIGHIGENDTFFWVVEGECFLLIDAEASIIKPGQLAFLPKGKCRTYTQISEHFTMYEIAFSATANGQNLMELLEMTSQNFVVDIPQREEINVLFERYNRVEMFQNPIHDVEWCANILRIIQMYAHAHQAGCNQQQTLFRPVVRYITDNLNQPLRTEELASLVHMQTTYFIRKFKSAFGIPPQEYLGRIRLYKAMGMLASTDLSIEKIAKNVGIKDASYFTRFFKKNCGITPSEYRNAFRKNNTHLSWTHQSAMSFS